MSDMRDEQAGLCWTQTQILIWSELAQRLLKKTTKLVKLDLLLKKFIFGTLRICRCSLAFEKACAVIFSSSSQILPSSAQIAA